MCYHASLFISACVQYYFVQIQISFFNFVRYVVKTRRMYSYIYYTVKCTEQVV